MTIIDQVKKASRGDRPVEPLIFEKHVEHARGVDLPPLDVPVTSIPKSLLGGNVQLPSLGQHDVMAHYTHLSDRNFSIDGNF